MRNFLENIFLRLQRDTNRVVMREIHGETFVSVTGGELLQRVQHVRVGLLRYGLRPGDRCALLAPNSIRWIAIDLALMAEGVIVVPLYSRQAAAELVTVMKDCQPRLLIAADISLGDAVAKAWSAVGETAGGASGNVDAAPRRATFDDLLPPSAAAASGSAETLMPPNPRTDSDLVTVVYTSGTSGEPKGVCLNTGNISFMLSRTTQRLDQLMTGSEQPDSVFHYLPLNFAASWIATLSFLLRDTVVTLSTDLNRLVDEIRLTSPHYFLNVPTLLERVRRGVDDAMAKRSAVIRSLFARSRVAWQRRDAGQDGALDSLWLGLGRKLIFAKITERFGPNLRALICGSAPLAPETQQFFQMLGIPVLQVYGLTETSGICTMDDPRVAAEPGHVGPSVDGIEMRTGDQQEIVVRGPHVFPGYWNREEETARVLQDGWFHTGDQGEVSANGNWRIVGRIKNLVILNSGHNIAPEPIEDKLVQLLPGAQHVVIVGNGRSYLCALIAGAVDRASVQSAIDSLNRDLPHYRQIRNFTVVAEALTPDNGLLTTMGKLRRAAINTRFAQEIGAMYDNARADRESASAGEADRKSARGKSA
jgi:long-chain acyl-CoA synthetase